MIRLRNAVVALATSLLAVGALAQNGFMQDSESVTVPEELFGGGAVELEFNDFEDASTPFVPKGKLIFAGAGLGMGTEFSVTYTLHNATFAESVSNDDFMWGSWGGATTDRGGTDCDLTTTDPVDVDDAALVFCPEDDEVEIERADGKKGDSSVTFDITVTADDINEDLVLPMLTDGDNNDQTPDTYTGVTRKIVFVVADLDVSGLRAANAAIADPGVHAMVSTVIAQTKSGGMGSKVSEDLVMGHACGMDASENTDARVACPVVKAHKVVTAIANTGGGGAISLDPDDMRMVLVNPAGKALDPQRIELSTVTVNADFGMGGVRDEDGEVLEDFSGSLDGNLSITVSSDSFKDGDVVYIDADGNKKAESREEFVITDGAASDTVDLVAGTPLKVYYQPSGEEALEHQTEFTINASTEFSDTDNKTRAAKAASATLALHGIQPKAAKAYAIAPLTSTDTANVRVTCESAAKTGCRVFLDCKDADGMSTFGEEGMMVGPGMTVRWSQMDIAMALGLDDGWEGRLGCDLLSTAPITVQILTRAAGVLVNNTAVSEGG